MKFSVWLDNQLEYQGWSQSEAARRGGISAAQVNGVVNETTQPGLAFCRGIAKAFALPLEDVFRLAGILPPLASDDPTAAPTPTTAPVVACVPASAAQLERIQAGVQGVQASNEVRDAWAVKSDDFENVWMVAALVYGPGMEDGAGPGVWAIGGVADDPGLTLAVNGMAKEFSDWPDASKTDAAMNGTEHGVAEAVQCAEAAGMQ